MQNFTEEIKNQITSRKFPDKNSKLAALSAFINTSGTVFKREGAVGFRIVTENERTAEYFTEILEEFGLTPASSGVKSDLLSGRDKLSFECCGNEAEEILKKLLIIDGNGDRIFGIDGKIIAKKNEKLAYISGCFLGGGSCTLPEEATYSRTGYHFEVVFPDRRLASDFCELLCDFEILAKLVMRKESSVVYVKSKEVISDILSVMSCDKCLEKLNKIVEYKDMQNNANRVNNCSVSNIDKTVTASVKLVQAIEIISQTIGLQSLDKGLFDVAECRLADKNASMAELAERLGISKSCINHRMRKILAIADSLTI